ncbi:MAG: GNAT family N-acetyltransferase [Myxococcales bacterium]|nr:GNAT family N-acetyltransferase [Myxococcales bacterium]
MTAGPPEVPLRTERLTLRDYSEDDFEAVHAYGSDPEVVRFMNWGPNDEAATRDFLARTIATTREEPRTNWELAMVLSETGELIGGCGLMPRRASSREWELGYVLRRDLWGHGFVPEAAHAVVQFGFGRLDAHRIYARIDPENRGSIRVAERLGMRLEGTFQRDEWIHGEWRDTRVYALLSDEWAAARPG